LSDFGDKGGLSVLAKKTGQAEFNEPHFPAEALNHKSYMGDLLILFIECDDVAWRCGTTANHHVRGRAQKLATIDFGIA